MVPLGCRPAPEPTQPEPTSTAAAEPAEETPVARPAPPQREYEFTAVELDGLDVEAVDFRDVALTPTGDRGVAVGRALSGWAALLFELEGGTWRMIELPELPAGAQLTDVVIDETGQHAWAIGMGVARDVAPIVLRRRDDGWAMDDAAVEFVATLGADAYPSAIAMTPGGEQAWLFGGDFSNAESRYVGGAARFDGTAWSRQDVPDQQEVFAVWLSRDGTRGWALGKRAGPMTLADGTWTQTSELVDLTTVDVWFDDTGREGWAVGGHISRLENGSWTTVPVDKENYWPGIWFDATGTVGFMVGTVGREQGQVSRWRDGQWAPVTEDVVVAQNNQAVALTRSADEGWIVGAGSLIHMVAKPL